MTIYTLEPWPSTYISKGEAAPKKLKSAFAGRAVGAMRVAIPAHTLEPPQIHLLAERDGQPFEELLTGFEQPFSVMYWDIDTGDRHVKIYHPGQDIVIPAYKIHWLMNEHDSELEFTCEYAPSPWDGDKDEPEFRDLETLLRFVSTKGLEQQLIDANKKY